MLVLTLLSIAVLATVIALGALGVAAVDLARRRRAVTEAEPSDDERALVDALTPAEAATLHPRGRRGFAAELVGLVASGAARIRPAEAAESGKADAGMRRSWTLELTDPELVTAPTTLEVIESLALPAARTGERVLLPRRSSFHRRLRTAVDASVRSSLLVRGLAAPRARWRRTVIAGVVTASGLVAVVSALAAFAASLSLGSTAAPWMFLLPWLLIALATAAGALLPLVRVPPVRLTARGAAVAAAIDERRAADVARAEPTADGPRAVAAAWAALPLAVVLGGELEAATRLASLAHGADTVLRWPAGPDGNAWATPAAFGADVAQFARVVEADGGSVATTLREFGARG